MRCAIFSTSCSGRRTTPIVAAACLWAACVVVRAADGPRVAVFPPADLTGRSAPVDQVRAAIEAAIAARGFAPVTREEMEEFFRRHRVRYVGGISADTARALGAETRAEGVLLTAIDDWEPVDPPRFALTSRWVTVAPDPALVWMDTSAQHGLERPGAFGLGIVTDPTVLVDRAAREIAASLAASDRRRPAERGPAADRETAPRRFRPGTFAVDPGWAATASAPRPHRVAVLPFIVDAPRREIGEVIAAQFVRGLLATGRVEVLEPGVVREALLEARVIQDEGPSLPQMDALHALLDVDLVVSGRVTDYEPIGSSPGAPFLGFSVRAIDGRTRQVVWSSFSFGRGDDRVGAFGTARIRSSITLASGLVRSAVDALEGEIHTRRPAQAGAERKDIRR